MQLVLASGRNSGQWSVASGRLSVGDDEGPGLEQREIWGTQHDKVVRLYARLIDGSSEADQSLQSTPPR